ncbi:hypothetical protein Tco_1375549 [Tanacetum coccineum]
MANLSHYGSDALVEVHNLDNMDNHMINQGVQVMPFSEQSTVVNHSETEITSDNNIIPYSHTNCSYVDKAIVFYDHTTKQALGFQNPFYLKKAQQMEPKLNDANVIKNTSAIVIPDTEETLMLAEESHLKMLLKQQDPMILEKKNSMNSSDPNPSCRPTKVEVPKELPKVSMVNTSLKKLKHHLAGFDVVVKERTTTTSITKGSWGCGTTSFKVKLTLKSGKWFQSSMDLTLSGPCLDADFLVADSKFMKVAFGDGFKMLLFNPLIVTTSRYVVPTGRVKVPAGSVVPTGKDSSIVSTGSTKVIPAVLYNLNRRKDLSRAGPTKGNKDVDMTDADQSGADQQNASQQSGFDQKEEDAHVTLTPVLDTQKIRDPTQSSSVSSDFTSKLLNLDNPSPTDTMIASLMDTTVHHEITSATTSSYEADATLSKFELTKILIDKMEKNKSFDIAYYKRELYDALTRRDERRKSSKDAESSKDSKSKEKKSSSTSNDASQSQHKSSGKSAHVEEPSHTVEDIKHVPKCQSFYGYASNLTSSKDVYSRRRLFAVTRLKIMKKYDYGHQEEIEVRRDDRSYMFKEHDFKRLRLQYIEDMLLLLVQQKLTNLTIDERYDLNVALHMYARHIFIQRRMEDLQ